MTTKPLKILVPIDGSDNARRALDHAIALVEAAGGEIEILNVQPPVSGAVAGFVGSTGVKAYHLAEADKVLASAKRRIEKAGIVFRHHVCVGQPGPTIAEFVRDSKCNHVVMGNRGLGAPAGLLLGSTAMKVIELVDVPVTLVK
jgi:nucleotide-binding universal stress UspA family protein